MVLHLMQIKRAIFIQPSLLLSEDIQRSPMVALSLLREMYRIIFTAEYDDLNATIVGISAGMYKELGDVLSAQMALKGKLKEFKGEPRDSNAFVEPLSLSAEDKLANSG